MIIVGLTMCWNLAMLLSNCEQTMAGIEQPRHDICHVQARTLPEYWERNAEGYRAYVRHHR